MKYYPDYKRDFKDDIDNKGMTSNIMWVNNLINK